MQYAGFHLKSLLWLAISYITPFYPDSPKSCLPSSRWRKTFVCLTHHFAASSRSWRLSKRPPRGQNGLGLTVGRIPQGECCCCPPLTTSRCQQGMTSAPPCLQSCFFLGQSPASLEESVRPSHDKLPAILRLCDLALAARALQGGQNQQQAAALPESQRNRAEIIQRRLPCSQLSTRPLAWLQTVDEGIFSVDRVDLSPRG